MKRKIFALLLPVLLAACANGGLTTTAPGAETTTPGAETTTPADQNAAATALAELQSDVATFSSEVQAEASPELLNAWNALNAELANLASSAQLGMVDDLTLQSARQAVEEVTFAVQAEADQLSPAFQDFWTDFVNRFNSAIAMAS
jgi:hypothetical protein